MSRRILAADGLSSDGAAAATAYEDLLARLREAEALLQAIRSGAVDALVIDGPNGKQVYTLAGTDRPYRVFVEAMPDGALTLDAAGTIVYCNASFAALLARPMQRILGRSLHDLLSPGQADGLRSLIDAARSGPAAAELSVRSHTGDDVPLHMSARLAGGSDGDIFCVVATDLRGQKLHEDLRQATDALRDSEERFRRASDAALALVYDVDLLQPRRTMHGLQRLTGYADAEHDGTCDWWRARIHPDDLPGYLRVVEEQLCSGGVRRLEYRFAHADGNWRWLQDSREASMTATGEAAARIIGVVVDITPRRQAEEQLRKHAQRQQLLSQTLMRLLGARDPAMVVDDVLRDVTAHLGMTMWLNYLMEPDGSTMRLHSICGVPRHLLPLFERIEVGYGLCGSSAQLRQPVIVADAQAVDDSRAALLREMGVRMYVCQPLLVGERLLGTLSFGTRDGTVLAEDDIAFLGTIAQYVALAMERSQREAALFDADRRKDEFLATLAHELRNPLAPIANAVRFMQLAPSHEWSQHDARDIIERQVRHLSRLVDDLLDISRVTSGKIALKTAPVDLRDVVEAGLETSRPVIDAAGHHLQLSLPAETLIVEGDLTRLAQVLSNLLINAAKYTPQRGRIELAVYREGDQAVMRVRDSGVGIPREMLPRIWDLFTQVDRNLQRAQGGLGIGLSLVRRLVTMHGGRVLADSDGHGKGCTFTIHLPVRPSGAQHAGEAQSVDSVAALPARRVLVVDDNVDSAQSLAALLSVRGHDVRVAHDGASAVAMAADFAPDAVLLDIGMPGMDGHAVARRLRAMEQLRHTRLIAQTGWGQERDQRLAQEAGFDHHLTKPVDLDALVRVLGSASPG